MLALRKAADLRQVLEMLNPPLLAGRALDALVAERVVGARSVREGRFVDVENRNEGRDLFADVADRVLVVPRYTTSITAAWAVVTRMRELGWVYCAVQSSPSDAERPEWDDATMTVEWWAEFSRYRSPVEVTSPHCETPALAICLAALRAMDALSAVDRFLAHP